MARTQRERDAERRALKLADMQVQVERGNLSIRQMTAEERKRFQPPERPEPRGRAGTRRGR